MRLTWIKEAYSQAALLLSVLLFMWMGIKVAPVSPY